MCLIKRSRAKSQCHALETGRDETYATHRCSLQNARRTEREAAPTHAVSRCMHQKTRNLPLGRTLPTYAGHDRDASANEDAFHLPGQGAVELVDFRRRARPPTVVVMSVCSRTEAGAQIRMSDGTSNFPASAREGDGTLHVLLVRLHQHCPRLISRHEAQLIWAQLVYRQINV